MSARKREEVSGVKEVSMVVPMAQLPEEVLVNAPRHVELQLTVRQRRGLKRARVALRASGAEVHGRQGEPRRVESTADAVRWLLEQLGEG